MDNCLPPVHPHLPLVRVGEGGKDGGRGDEHVTVTHHNEVLASHLMKLSHYGQKTWVFAALQDIVLDIYKRC